MIRCSANVGQASRVSVARHLHIESHILNIANYFPLIFLLVLPVGHYIASCETVYDFYFRTVLERGACDGVILRICTTDLKHEKHNLKIIFQGRLAGSIGRACDS